jgi:hypothetical protein
MVKGMGIAYVFHAMGDRTRSLMPGLQGAMSQTDETISYQRPESSKPKLGCVAFSLAAIAAFSPLAVGASSELSFLFHKLSHIQQLLAFCCLPCAAIVCSLVSIVGNLLQERAKGGAWVRAGGRKVVGEKYTLAALLFGAGLIVANVWLYSLFH